MKTISDFTRTFSELIQVSDELMELFEHVESLIRCPACGGNGDTVSRGIVGRSGFRTATVIPCPVCKGECYFKPDDARYQAYMIGVNPDAKV